MTANQRLYSILIIHALTKLGNAGGGTVLGLGVFLAVLFFEVR